MWAHSHHVVPHGPLARPWLTSIFNIDQTQEAIWSIGEKNEEHMNMNAHRKGRGAGVSSPVHKLCPTIFDLPNKPPPDAKIDLFRTQQHIALLNQLKSHTLFSLLRKFVCGWWISCWIMVVPARWTHVLLGTRGLCDLVVCPNGKPFPCFNSSFFSFSGHWIDSSS